MSRSERLLRASVFVVCGLALTRPAFGQEFDGTDDRLQPGERLLAGESLTSADGRYELAYQTDGNLVLYDGATGVALWWTGTVSAAPGEAVMQGDGNFVVYNADGTPVWWSGTAGYDNAEVIVQGDANVVVYAPGGIPLWWSAGSNSDVAVLTGTVFDAISGEPIAGAVVSLNGGYQTTTDAYGRYSVVGLPNYGSYNVRYVSADGHESSYQFVIATFENIYLFPFE